MTQKFYTRKGEEVGGGWFIFRRGKLANRVKPSKMPFEHPTFDSAYEELMRLREKSPDSKFVILREVISP